MTDHGAEPQPTRLRRRIAAGQPAFGATCLFGVPLIAETFALSDLDYFYIDRQHGYVSPEQLTALIFATARSEVTTLVRVSRNDEAEIGAVLDLGAEGVIVPMVETAGEAERAVAGCHVPPKGVRSAGWHRVGMDDSGGDPLCFVMIETRKGIENVEEIASTPGVTGLYIGVADLALSMGLPRTGLRIRPGEHADGISAVVAACRAAGIVAGLSGDPRAMVEAGFGMVTLGSDLTYFKAGLAAAVASTR